MSIKIYEAYRLKKQVDPFPLLWDLKGEGQRRARERLRKIFEDVLEGRSHTAHLQIREQQGLFTAWARENHGEELEKTPSLSLSLYAKWEKEHCPPEFRVAAGIYPASNEEVLTAARRDAAEGMRPGIFDVDAWALAKYGEQLARFERNAWALDTCVAARRFRDRFYLIPYCDRACLLAGCLEFMQTDGRLEDFSYWNNSDRPEEVTSQDWAWRATVWNELTDHDKWLEFVTLDVVSWHGWPQVSPMMEIARERGIGGP